jgi:ubiquinone/menaquinone biosynthesis C-methylase UbiE
MQTKLCYNGVRTAKEVQGMSEPWYEQSFQEDYLLVYKHRNLQNAQVEVRAMSDWLKLPAGASVMDLCCGSGRHSFILQRLGYHVTGVDLSETLLQAAKTGDPNQQIRWIRADMRQVPLEEQFDAVFNMFTSFGYFDTDAENQQVLHEMCRLLKIGGQFVIDFLNPNYIMNHLVPHSIRREDQVTIEEHRHIENGFVVKRIDIHVPHESTRTYREQVKLYGFNEFKTMFKRAGLELRSAFGNYDGSPYDETRSPRLILVGARKEELR